ncbi:sensor histidine kinase [Kitasatospora viridis]|uniref:histidine kinase n=1 Tax=Kitasatospora viridis TaxID=281105 RepID=A0A561UCG6_9ACTN|nr:sensor histidine kinase [Kitasatospora viridis]TWF97029.1 histidine kinase [Kitasatospora viridis]
MDTSEASSSPSAENLRTAAFDMVLAVLLGAGVALSPLLFSHRGTTVPGDALGVVTAAALLVRRSRPLPALVVVTAAAAAALGMGDHPTPAALAVGAALLSVAGRTEWWVALSASALALAVVLLPYLVRALGSGTPFDEVWGFSAQLGVLLLVPGTLPAAVRLRRRAVARAEAEEIRRRVAEERLGIAREVHDVVGHALAVISMQSGIALHVSEKRPEQMADALDAVGRVSREAMTELDATFGVFREMPAEPDLGLQHLDELLATVRRAGVAVELTVSGERVPLPAEVERAAYRIVQESLTNVLHHAEADAASVELDYSPRALLVRVGNGAGPPAGAEPARPRSRASGGHGIQGMKERTEALGGLLEAGPRPGGGFVVTARLPRAS